jgi:hypothetical protein
MYIYNMIVEYNHERLRNTEIVKQVLFKTGSRITLIMNSNLAFTACH